MYAWAFARFLPVVIAVVAGVGAASKAFVVSYWGEPNLPGLADYGEGPTRRQRPKVLNVKVEARKTAHDGLFLPPDAPLQLVCLKTKPLIPCDVAFQIGSKALISEIRYRLTKSRCGPV